MYMSVILLTEKTSGHISSMITLAEQLIQNKFTIYFLISNSTHETDIFQRLPYKYSIYTSLLEVNTLFNRLKPDLIINTGGRFAYPIVVLARFKQIKSFTIEQNYYPGLTNVLMSPFTTIYATQLVYKKLYHEEKVILHPPIVRSDVFTNKNELKNKMGIDLNKPVLVVLTGTNGNKEINDLLEKNLLKLVGKNIHVIWQIGINVTLKNKSIPGVTMVPFLDNIYEIYAIADYVITSSGINTINELLSLDIPFKLIPYKISQFNHQYHNALYTNNIKSKSSVYSDDYTGIIDNIIDEIKIRPPLFDIKVTYPIISDIKMGKNQADDCNIFYLLLCSLFLYMKFQIFIFFDGCITKKFKTPLCSNYAYYEEIPELLGKSIILAEDGAFMVHNGYPHTFKNLLILARRNYPVSGIVQQLLKNMYFHKYQNKFQKIFRKITELLMTYFINTVYSKKVIVEYYLNCISYVDYQSKELPSFGIKNICKHLFNKNMSDLDLFEIIFLSVTLPDPVAYYNRFVHKHKIGPFIHKKMLRHLEKGKKYKNIPESEINIFMEKLLSYTK